MSISIIEPGGFIHCVYFWLKNPSDASDRLNFERLLKKFISSSEFVKSAHIGTMAASNRDVVDSTYTYCLIAAFDDKNSQDKYQEEPAHIEFIRNAGALWEKVVVYDSLSTY